MLRHDRVLKGLDEEIRDHIERETQDNIDRGLSPNEARRQARVRFGNVALTKEDTRSVWAWVWAEQFVQDVRYALRTHLGNPTFALVVILTLAVAIGMNTAVFSMFNAVVLRPLGYPNADRLVWLSTMSHEGELGIVRARISPTCAIKPGRSIRWWPMGTPTTRLYPHEVRRASGRRG